MHAESSERHFNTKDIIYGSVLTYSTFWCWYLTCIAPLHTRIVYGSTVGLPFDDRHHNTSITTALTLKSCSFAISGAFSNFLIPYTKVSLVFSRVVAHFTNKYATVGASFTCRRLSPLPPMTFWHLIYLVQLPDVQQSRQSMRKTHRNIPTSEYSQLTDTCQVYFVSENNTY